MQTLMMVGQVTNNQGMAMETMDQVLEVSNQVMGQVTTDLPIQLQEMGMDLVDHKGQVEVVNHEEIYRNVDMWYRSHLFCVPHLLIYNG